MKPITRIYFIVAGAMLFSACATHSYSFLAPAGEPPQDSRIEALTSLPEGDTDVVSIRCAVKDLEDQQLMYHTVVVFNRMTDRNVQAATTGENGFFTKKLKPGFYNVEIRFTGKTYFKAENMLLEGGRHYDMQIGLGKSSAYKTYTIASRRKLNQKQIEKRGRRMAERDRF